MTKILFIGASLTKNMGGPSLLISTCKILKAHIPDAEFTLWSSTPVRDSEKASVYGVKVIGTLRHGFRSAVARCLLWAALQKLRLNKPGLLNKNNLLQEYTAADIIIDIMGISFTDFFPGWKQNIVDGVRLSIGGLLGKPAVKFTQDMGPFHRMSTRYAAKFFLSKLNLIIARSVATQTYLKDIGITGRVHVRPDSAFVLDPAPPERIDEIMHQENLNKRPIIGITPTIQIDRRLSGKNIEVQNKYTAMMAQIADYLIETLNSVVVFIPNETSGDYDDIYVIKKIFVNVKNKGNIRMITAEYSAEELKGLIGTCDLLIGSRYHSVIAATSMCVPTLVIGWGHKYNEVMKTVGLSDFEFDFNAITYEQLQREVARLWRDREKIRSLLALKIPAIKETVMSGGRLVKNILS